MSKDLPLISIITVVYNGESYLEATIQSIIDQKYPRIEYIVVDGGSSDATIHIIKKHANRVSRWVTEQDNGIYDAMNKGLSMATGDWVNFLNGGDRFHSPETLERIFGSADFEQFDFVYGDAIIFSAKSKHYIKAKPISKMSLKSGIDVCHQSMFIRRSITPKYNLRYKYKAEYNWVLDIFSKMPAERSLYIHMPIVYYALGGFSEKGLLKNLQEFIQITFLKFGLWQTILNFPHYTRIFLRHIKYKISGYER